MVPKAAGKGTSFKGAGLYYLHDKQALTAERVAFTHTENLPTDNPDLALKIMAHTAMRQDELKAWSGQAKTGRKLEYCVYTYSLSWAPDEAPTQEEMLAAGRETLKVLGLDSHETLMVAHRDEPQPHLHLIVNRVHPETGKAAGLSCDHLDLSKWAEAYEREQGKIRCEERVKNNEERRARKAKGLNGFVKHQQSLDTAAFVLWRKDRLHAAFLARQAEEKNLSAYHKGQRQALFDEKERRIEQRRQDIRAASRPQWAFLYRQQESDAQELHRAQKGAFSRVLYWLQHRSEMPSKGVLRGALEAVLGRHDFAAAMRVRHEADRKALANRIAEQSRQAIRQENEAHRTELDMLRHEQAHDSRTLRELHTQVSQNLAREVAERGDMPKFDKETAERQRAETLAKPVHEQFRDRVRKRITKAKKRRDERGKGHGRERED